jgi:hypothetical protein
MMMGLRQLTRSPDHQINMTAGQYLGASPNLRHFLIDVMRRRGNMANSRFFWA